MKVKSIGFAITNDNINVNNSDLMAAIIKTSNRIHSHSDYSRQILISEDVNYYKGLVVTFRTQKKNCKSTSIGGKFELKVEDLINGEKLVSFNFFAIKKSTMKGLFMYHHGSCSLNGLFTHLQTISNEFIRTTCANEIESLGDKAKQKVKTAINKKYKIRPSFNLITNNSDISSILRKFKKINHASFKFDYIDFKGGPMTALEPYTNSTQINFNIDPKERSKTSPLAQTLSDIYKGFTGISKARVTAIDFADNEKVVNFMNCPVFFETYDFDVIAPQVDGVTNDNYQTNGIFDMIINEIESGANKNAFN